MKKQTVFLITYIVISLASLTVAADVLWTNDGTTPLWVDANNWSSGLVPDSLTDVRIAVFSPDEGPLIIAGDSAQCHAFKLRDNTMTMTGGNLHVHNWGGVGSYGGSSATLIMSGNSSLTVDSTFDIGYEQQGLMVMNDNASVTTANRLMVGRTYDGTNDGVGHLQLNGGIFNTTHLVINNDGSLTFGTVDLAGGKLIIEANEVDSVNNYISQGILTAYGGHPRAAVDVSYIDSNTVITSSIPDIFVAWNPIPADDTNNVEPDLTLRWSEGEYVSQHDVFIGTSFEDINSAVISNLDVYKGRFDVNYYSPNDLNLDETYYWRVDEVNDTNIWKGPVWSFTVKREIAIDDFESYSNSSELNSIWQTSGTASLFLVSDLCRSGLKSMRLNYNNASSQDANAILNFDPAMDWTKYDPGVLTLWLYGTAPDSSEQIQITIESSDGKSATLIYSDPCTVLYNIWNLWYVELEELVNEINLAQVSKLIISVVNEGTGSIYIDDISLNASRCKQNYNCGSRTDFNCDYSVNFYDFAQMAYSWFTGQGDIDFDYGLDLNNDNMVGSEDMDFVAEDWLIPDYDELTEISDLSHWDYFARSGPIDLPDSINPLTPETSGEPNIPLRRDIVCVMPVYDDKDIDRKALYKSAEWLDRKIYQLVIKDHTTIIEEDKSETMILFGTMSNNPFISTALESAGQDPDTFLSGITGDGYRISFLANPWTPGEYIILLVGASETGSWNSAVLFYGAFDKQSRFWQPFEAVNYGIRQTFSISHLPEYNEKIIAEELLPIGIDMWNYPTISLNSFSRVVEALKSCQMNTVRISPSGFQDVVDPALSIEKLLDIANEADVKLVVNIGNEQLTHTPHELTENHWKTICRIKKHPALLAYLLYDELGGGEAYKDVAEQLAWLRKADSNHPVNVIIASSFETDGFTSAQEERVKWLRDRGVEIITMDYYPWGNWVEDSNISRWESKIQAGYDVNIIPWAIIQAHTTTSEPIMPTPEMIRNQTWWCIAARARGYFYANPCLYNNRTNRGFLSYDLRPHHDGRFEEICQLVPMIKKLKSMLKRAEVTDGSQIGLEFNGLNGFDVNEVEIRYMYEQQRDQKYMILVNNLLDQTFNTAFTVKRPALDSQLCDIVDGNVVSPSSTNGLYATYDYPVIEGGGASLAYLRTAWNPAPADEDKISTSPTLSWLSGVSAYKYDLYFGTDYSAVKNASDYSNAPGIGRLSTNNYMTTDLELGKYYWRVDLINSSGEVITKGDIWSFSITD